MLCTYRSLGNFHVKNICRAVAKIFRVSGDPTDPSSTISAKLFWGRGSISSN